MNIDSYLEASRDIYVAALRSAMRSNGACHIEPALRDRQGDLVLEGELQTPYRPDLVVEATGESVMVDSPSRAKFEPVETVHLGVPIEVTPFIWDYASFQLHQPKGQDWEKLRSIFVKWFDVDDANQADSHGLYGVIHYVSDPKVEGRESRIIVDFGSAPINAFYEVLESLCALQPARIIVG